MILLQVRVVRKFCWLILREILLNYLSQSIEIFIMKQKFFLLLVALLIYSPFILSAQNNNDPHTQKQETGKYIKAEMKAEQIPGLAYAVVWDHKIIDSGAYGMSNVELNAPVNMQSLFNIGSI